MKVLGIVCSPRRRGNTEILVDEALASAKDSGAEVELVTVSGKNIAPCDGCESCIITGKCRIEDDMQEKSTVYLVGARCTPELDEEFNRWYDETHIPMLLKSPWLEGVTRYKLAPVMEGDYPEYLVICEFKSRQAFEAWVSGPEVHAAREELKETWKDKDLEIKWRVVYEPLKTWGK